MSSRDRYSTPRHHPDLVSSLRPSRKGRKPWQPHLSLDRHSSQQVESEEYLSREHSRATAGTSSCQSTKRWKIHLFVTNDIRRRTPFYLSDWTDAWDYRVVPATVYMYF